MTHQDSAPDEDQLNPVYTDHLDGFLALPTNLQRALVRTGRAVAGMSDRERRVNQASFRKFAELESLPEEVRKVAGEAASIVTGVMHRSNTQEVGPGARLQAEQQRRWLELRSRQ
ncbi:hypothetical protein M3697_05295 [Janibacter melonis]|uniref:hypothetical protein n=1 Tax=Janibacter melonis TaxID=262209 RepID=UPI0020442032|nr:hypothetical protein [Janibacter melonis]MCM3554521.1 hypothetical protein [Janibacter melonis]